MDQTLALACRLDESHKTFTHSDECCQYLTFTSSDELLMHKSRPVLRFVFSVTAVFPLIVSCAALLIDEKPVLRTPKAAVSQGRQYTLVGECHMQSLLYTPLPSVL